MKRRLKIWLIVSSIICAVLTFFSLPMILMSPMMFDAPGSTENPSIYLTLFSLIAFPFVAVISTIVAWILFKKNCTNLALTVSLLPYINLVVFVYAFLNWD